MNSNKKYYVSNGNKNEYIILYIKNQIISLKNVSIRRQVFCLIAHRLALVLYRGLAMACEFLHVYVHCFQHQPSNFGII
jgi:hypothetical protein